MPSFRATGDACFPEPFLLQFASIEAAQRRIPSRSMNGSLAPEKTQHGIALFGELAQSLPSAVRVFARNHPDVTGQRLRIDKSCGIAKEDFRGERGDRAHTWS
jgi:hypothetical protein